MDHLQLVSAGDVSSDDGKVHIVRLVSKGSSLKEGDEVVVTRTEGKTLSFFIFRPSDCSLHQMRDNSNSYPWLEVTDKVIATAQKS